MVPFSGERMEAFPLGKDSGDFLNCAVEKALIVLELGSHIFIWYF